MTHSNGVLRLILLVSCAHAMVHLLEQSIASMEQVISDEFTLNLEQSGLLGSALRLPYGIGAFFAGLLADRFGEKRILVLYLLGAAFVAGSFLFWTDASIVYIQLLLLGAFASMYHPAGLALLASQTAPADRSRALGIHGIFGSLGIACAPFLAGITLSLRPGDWRGYYLLLGLLSAALGLAVWRMLKPVDHSVAKHSVVPGMLNPPTEDAVTFQFWPFTTMVVGSALTGTVYSGVVHFLPRYLKEAGAMSILETLSGQSISEAALGNYAAALALVCGAFGQWAAARMASPRTLPVLLSIVYAGNIPLLLWMVFASGSQRLIAACIWAFVHFMNQPLYNSLLPEFIPRHRRSLGFGFSNMMGFGVGAFGPNLVAVFDDRFQDYTLGYYALAGLAFLAALLPLVILSGKIAVREHDRAI